VGNRGKRVTICSPNEAQARALRLLLDDYEVSLAEDPENSSKNGDILVWAFGGMPLARNLEDVVRAVPTLIIADPGSLIEAVDAGCRGFLADSTSLEEIRDAVVTIAEGGAVLPPDLLGTLLRHIVHRRRTLREASGILDELTERERQVFRLAANGARKQAIADELFISPATARTHLQRLYRKLGVHSQAELIALAVRLGEFDQEEDLP
jgi:DNA-binding NarL/FixJ family response regulator